MSPTGNRPAHLACATPEGSLLLVIDVQERLFPHVHGQETLEEKLVTLTRGLHLLGVPVVATEQYVKGLGATVPAVREALPEGTPVMEKVAFSCCGEPAVMERVRALDRRSVFLSGIEAHVCVMQTALDLLKEGCRVHVVRDAVGSRTAENKEAGLARMERAGAVVSTVEMALFELMGSKDHPRFKDVQALVK